MAGNSYCSHIKYDAKILILARNSQLEMSWALKLLTELPSKKATVYSSLYKRQLGFWFNENYQVTPRVADCDADAPFLFAWQDNGEPYWCYTQIGRYIYDSATYNDFVLSQVKFGRSVLHLGEDGNHRCALSSPFLAWNAKVREVEQGVAAQEVYSVFCDTIQIFSAVLLLD